MIDRISSACCLSCFDMFWIYRHQQQRQRKEEHLASTCTAKAISEAFPGDF